MHEWGITQDLIDEVIRQAQMHNIKKVRRVEIALGKLSGLTPSALKLCFRALTGEEVDRAKIPNHSHVGENGEHLEAATEIARFLQHNQERNISLKGCKLDIKKTADHKIIVTTIEGEQTE